eukprot:TRINITY_DN9158_c0_g1_i1.p1 TRINITY_DN9158_c0_g1~~TRINITY_DN9158_c0_g1_i1.p1  ORF type:complete len:1553 (-),score=515.25 TRINITY_DN9158_c0_g1_i1:131-4789(-)
MPRSDSRSRSPSPYSRSPSPNRRISRSPSPDNRKGNASDEEDEEGLEFRDQRQKHLVNPLTIGNPKIDYAEVFGYDLDPENLQPGMKIWRMDHLNPIELTNPKLFGQFHSNDSYIILHITGSGDKLIISVHHWQGRGATVDKYGSAAIRAIELNIYLGGACRVYRETEGQESEQFKGYFQEELEYLFGGTESAFKHVIPNNKVYEPRMFQIRKLPRMKHHQVKLVEPTNKSLNKHDVFILDVGERIYQWNGSGATRLDKFKGLEVASLINNVERAGFARRVVIEDGENPEDMLYEINMFWDYIGGHIELPEIGGPLKIKTTFNYIDKAGAIAVLVKGSWDNYKDDVPLVEISGKFSGCVALLPGVYQYHYKIVTEDDVSYEIDEERKEVKDFYGVKKNEVEVLADETNIILYNTYMKDGKLDLQQSDAKTLNWNMLNTKHAYILDAESEVFVWLGKQSSKLERTVANALAQKFMQFDRPSFTPLIKFYETAEPMSFRQKFAKWQPLPKLDYRKVLLSNIAPPLPKPKWDAIDLIEGWPAKEPAPFDDGKGQAEVWVLSGPGPAFEKIPQTEKGYFFSKQCYLVLYSYADQDDHGKRKYVAYFWEGRDTNSCKWWPSFLYGFYPLLEKKIGSARLRPERVLDHKEPEHFLSIFGGIMFVRKGNRSKLMRRMRRSDALFDVHQESKIRTHAIQVPTQTSSLISRDSFVLATQTKLYVWYGYYSRDAEREQADRIAKMLKTQLDRPITSFEEGSENSEFWELLGGKGDYFDRAQYQKYCKADARLFHCSFGSGEFEIREKDNICQSDVITLQEDCLIIDAYCELFVWHGSGSSEYLRSVVAEIAKDYRKEAEYKRKLSEIPITFVESGKEPPVFTRHFHAWAVVKKGDENYVDPYEKRSKHAFELEFNEYKEEQKRKKTERKDRKREKKVHPERFVLKRVDFRPELERINIHVPEIQTKADSSSPAPSATKTDDNKTIFEYVVSSDSEVLAVMLKGSWNDGEDIPMIATDANKYATAVELQPGRYHYRYKIATEDGVIFATDTKRPVTTDDDGNQVNILRVLRKKGQPEPEKKEEQAQQEENEDESKANESFGRVVITYVDPSALAVELFADWLDWQSLPLVQKEDGSFTKVFDLEPGKYKYRYRVASEDGLTWETDKERAISVEDSGVYNNLQVFAKLVRGKYVNKEHQEMENMTMEEKRRLQARSELGSQDKRMLEKKKKLQEERAEQRRLEEEARQKKEEEEKRRKREEKAKERQRELELQQQQWQREREEKAKAEARARQLEEERRKAEEKAEEELRAIERERRKRQQGITTSKETESPNRRTRATDETTDTTSTRRSRLTSDETPSTDTTSTRRSRLTSDDTSSTDTTSTRRSRLTSDDTSSTDTTSTRRSRLTSDDTSSTDSTTTSARRSRLSSATEETPTETTSTRRSRLSSATEETPTETTSARRSRLSSATESTDDSTSSTRRSRATASEESTPASTSETAAERRRRLGLTTNTTASDDKGSTETTSRRARASETATSAASSSTDADAAERARLRAERRRNLGLDN